MEGIEAKGTGKERERKPGHGRAMEGLASASRKAMQATSDAFLFVSVASFVATFLSFVPSVLTGTVLCILQGTGIVGIGWFWSSFPLWGPWLAFLSASLASVLMSLGCGFASDALRALMHARL